MTRCSFCEVNEARTGSKHCDDCEKLADDALDEMYGGKDEFDKAIARAFRVTEVKKP